MRPKGAKTLDSQSWLMLPILLRIEESACGRWTCCSLLPFAESQLNGTLGSKIGTHEFDGERNSIISSAHLELESEKTHLLLALDSYQPGFCLDDRDCPLLLISNYLNPGLTGTACSLVEHEIDWASLRVSL